VNFELLSIMHCLVEAFENSRPKVRLGKSSGRAGLASAARGPSFILQKFSSSSRSHNHNIFPTMTKPRWLEIERCALNLRS